MPLLPRALFSRARTPRGRLVVTSAVLGSLALVPLQLAAAQTPAWEYDARIDIATLPASHAPAPDAVDWDEDGDLDLVVGMGETSQYGGIAVFLRGADGTLPAEPVSVWTGGTSPLGATERYFRPVVADWNGDGKKDLLYGQQSSGFRGVVACLNQGTDAAPVYKAGAATCRLLYAGPNSEHMTGHPTGSTGNGGSSSSAYVSPEVVDWDGDRDLDLVVGAVSSSASPGGVRLYENLGAAWNGMPKLALPVDVVTPATAGLEGETSFEPAVDDTDGDGDLDLLVAGGRKGTSGYESNVHTCLNTGSAAAPAFDGRCTTEVQTGLLYNTIDAADWDGDGVRDVLRGYYGSLQQNPVTMLHGKGPDDDGDGISNPIDNCPSVANPAELKLNRDNPVQLDNDGDRVGDPCDADLDGDGVPQVAAASEGATVGPDNCVYRPNGDQGDVDGDGRGNVCDPKDGRPEAYGVGTYEWQQAERTAWGRKPVMVMRADAMSIGYRQTIAERMVEAAFDRELPISLAMIPWDGSRLSKAKATPFLQEHADNPLLEAVQHGTYHVCVLDGKPAYGEEFGPACDMDQSQSYNLMKVGKDAMDGALAGTQASHALTGFIPPADAANAAAVQAAQSLGYSYFASAYYAEPKMFHTDEAGMVRVPWSQIACGNGAADWTNCAQSSISAHGGIDCSDPELCTPTRRGNGAKDYSDWQKFSDTRMSERCRGDFDRYGICAVLFELTSYDKDFATGEPDEKAMQAFELTLDELKAMAEEEDAVWMTVGEYAASQRAVDAVAPSIEIASPAEQVYGPASEAVVDVEVSDEVSGVHEVAITLDDEPIANGAALPLATLAEGEHVLAVRAEDEAGNVSEQSVTFTLDASGPQVQISSPTERTYAHSEQVAVDVRVTDEVAGVDAVALTLDGTPVENGDTLDLVGLPLGDHVLAVRAEDEVGNVTEQSVTVTVEATVASLRALVERYAADGSVSGDGVTKSLLAKLDATAASQAAGKRSAAEGQLKAFVNEVTAQREKKIATASADVLLTDAEAVRAALGSTGR